MDGSAFIKETEFKLLEIDAFLRLVVFSYYQLVKDSKVYRRAEILETIKRVTESEDAHNEIEDYLCDDLVDNYIRPNKHLFGLQYYAVNTGVKESKENVKIGILDLKFELCTLAKDHYYVFEAKRIDKYSVKQNYYIDHGIQRFTKRTYYPESNVTVAGMIGFVEVDLTKFPKGKAVIADIYKKLGTRLSSKTHIKTNRPLEIYHLKDSDSKEVNDFEHSYVSGHLRNDNVPFTIHHLLLDYYEILEN